MIRYDFLEPPMNWKYEQEIQRRRGEGGTFMDELKMIKGWISDFIDDYVQTHSVETRWREPVVGAADAHDPLYRELQKTIPMHALPEDIIAGAQSVIVFFVPYDESIGKSNIPGEESSREWDYAYVETNNMLNACTSHLYEKITSMGYGASNLIATYNYDREKLYCGWSHRSSAYVAGIGTFGLNNMLITDQGCCGRVSSVITTWKIRPTPRTGQENCLYKARGVCKKCMERCVNSAFSLQEERVNFDRFKCQEQLHKIVPCYEAPIGTVAACGKCLCGVPCSFTNPSKYFQKGTVNLNG